MPQRFYFDLTNEEVFIRDDDGVDASGPDEAFEEAHAALEDFRGRQEAPGLGDGWRLVIRDESGITLKAISLDDTAVH